MVNCIQGGCMSINPELAQVHEYMRWGAMAVPVLLAFSKHIRKLIGQRDKWHCQADECDKSYQKGYMVHVSHFNHNKSEPTYDTVEAGEILCVGHHLMYHKRYKGNAGEIGLQECQNDFAIDQLSKTNKRLKK